jgi:hypothetical protein
MKFCRVSKRIVPDEAVVCPFHHGTECLGTAGGARPARANGPRRAPAGAADETSLRLELSGLEGRIRASRRRGRRLALGAGLAIAVGLASWAAAYAHEVRDHAEVCDLTITRDPTDPTRVAVTFQPLTTGRVEIRRSDADRETELIDRAAAGGGPHRVEWRWVRMCVGDVVRVTYRHGWSLATYELTVPPVPPAPPLGTAVLSGHIVDATTSSPLPGAQVHIVGTELRATTTPAGEFRLTGAPDGPVGIKISAPRFCTVEAEKELRAGREERLEAALSPGMSRGQLRLVLTWGNEPADLDAHLEGPLPGGKRFHIFFGDQGDLASKEYVNLDIDCQEGRGPETITVFGVQPGVYHYYVHDFTNVQNLQSSALALSGAKVELYQGGQMLRRFSAKLGAIGNVWHVCDIEVTADQSARVTGLDTYESKVLKLNVALTCLILLDNPGDLTDHHLNRMKGTAAGILPLLRFDRGMKAGLVSSDRDGVRILAPTANQRTLRDAIAAIGPGSKAPLAKGLESAFHTLSAIRGQRTVAVLTQGSPDDRMAVEHWRDRLKKIGVEIVVFGIGSSDRAFLNALASDPEKVKLISDE